MLSENFNTLFKKKKLIINYRLVKNIKINSKIHNLF